MNSFSISSLDRASISVWNSIICFGVWLSETLDDPFPTILLSGLEICAKLWRKWRQTFPDPREERSFRFYRGRKAFFTVLTAHNAIFRRSGLTPQPKYVIVIDEKHFLQVLRNTLDLQDA